MPARFRTNPTMMAILINVQMNCVAVIALLRARGARVREGRGGRGGARPDEVRSDLPELRPRRFEAERRCHVRELAPGRLARALRLEGLLAALANALGVHRSE